MKISSPQRNMWLSIFVALVLLLSSLTTASSQGKKELKFVGIDLNSAKTTNADNKLVNYLTLHAPVKVVADEAQTYERMIRKLVEWKPEDGFYLARVTPYVFVAASMLGADFEILATYQNPKDESIYHSYFVVNRKVFQSSNGLASAAPTLGQIVKRLREKPVQFIYHDKFSTSSY